MSFNAREIAFLQHLVATGSGQKGVSLASRHFHRHFGMGRIVGQAFVFAEKDAQIARQLLINAGLPLSPPDQEIRRSEAARNNPADEKSGTLAPHQDSIAIKTAHGLCDLDGQPVASVGYQVLTLEQSLRVRADALLLVENLESMRFLERNRWIEFDGLSVLAVFRGDRLLRPDVAASFLDASSLPVWAYFDFDPAGLGLAARLPRLDRILLPDEARLAAAARKANQVHLFADQIAQWGPSLALDGREIVKRPWALMQLLRLGLAQEIMDSI